MKLSIEIRLLIDEVIYISNIQYTLISKCFVDISECSGDASTRNNLTLNYLISFLQKENLKLEKVVQFQL